MNTIVLQIEELLRTHSCWYELFEHEPVRTSEEASKVRPDYSMQQGAKALIVRIKETSQKKYFIMLVVPGDQKFDATLVKQLTNAKDIRFATEEEVIELTGGVLPGGVPPFGSIFDLKTIADESLASQEKIIFNAGDKSISIGMYSNDYLSLEKPQLTRIV